MRRLLQDVRSLDFRSSFALLLAAFVLVTIQFRGKSDFWARTDFIRQRFPDPLEAQFACQIAWAAVTVLGFGVVPFLAAVLVLRMRPSEFGFSLRGFFRHIWVYLAMFGVMIPLIWWASQRQDFVRTYPFAALARTDDRYLMYWEVAYFLQFCALEMFFRGFLIFSLEKRFGFGAVFVMTIPYAMIHFSKPMPEAFGAIFAGVMLGYLALRTRSFYGGILLHYSVALTMDLLARSQSR